MRISKYEIVVLSTFIMSVYGLYQLVSNNEWIWLLGTWLMIRVNHMCLSLHHRMISHRSFDAGKPYKRYLIILLSTLQVNHSPLRYAIIHRHHHQNSDTEKDIHGPSVGFWNNVFWEFFLEDKFTKLQIRIPKDLLRDRFLVMYDRHYYKILFGISLIIYLISAKFFWYVFIPASVLWKLEANLLINWYCHRYGYKNYYIEPDKAKNSILSGVLTMGEGWHNNHHANPGNYNFRCKWYEFDPTAWLIKKYFIR